MIKYACKMFGANFISWWILKTFFCHQWRDNNFHEFSSILWLWNSDSAIVYGKMNCKNRETKPFKVIKIFNRYRSVDDMILYIINWKLHTKKQLELINEFVNLVGQNFNLKTTLSMHLCIQLKNVPINGTVK